MTERLLIVLAGCLALPVAASSIKPAEVEYTVQQVLAQEGAFFLSYSVGDNGHVILLFGSNEPDWRIKKAVEALQSRPDIPGLTWTKTDTEFCPVR